MMSITGKSEEFRQDFIPSFIYQGLFFIGLEGFISSHCHTRLLLRRFRKRVFFFLLALINTLKHRKNSYMVRVRRLDQR